MYMRKKLYETLCKVTLEDFQTEEEMKVALQLKELLKPVVKPRAPRTRKEKATVGV
jgi:hypothetical protein